MHGALLGAFALLLPIHIQFVNVAVMQCLLLAKGAGRRKSKDFKKDCILSKQSAVFELLSYDRVKITSVYLLKAQWLLHVLPALTSQILRFAHRWCLCVLYGSQRKRRLFSYTTLTDRIL
jgi:hypothetical protein